MNLVIFGPQGSGKGTQGHMLSEDYDLHVVDAGQILREAAAKHNPRGKQLREFMNHGRLVPSKLMNEIITTHLNSVSWKKGLLFDGYPRKKVQLHALERYMKHCGEDLDAVVYLSISQQTTVERLRDRVLCNVCGRIYNLSLHPPKDRDTCVCGGVLIRREDDTPRAIRTRLKVFHKQTKPLLEIFEKQGILITIDAEDGVHAVYKKVVTQLKARGAID